MNLDLLFLATELTGHKKYAEVAISQAEVSAKGHVRPDFTTYHVVNLNRDGTVGSCLTHQGYQDESTWSRGQAWAIHGFAQVGECIQSVAFKALTPDSPAHWTQRFH